MARAPLARLGNIAGGPADVPATCLWIQFLDSGGGTKALLDQGAGISLMPYRVYHDLTNRKPLRQSDRRIEAVNKSSVPCHGMVYLDIKIGHHTCKQRFYVCDNDVSTLLGRDFLSDSNVTTTYYKAPAKPQVLVKGKPVPSYTYKSKILRNRVSLIESVTVQPGQEIQLQGRVSGSPDTDNTPCVVEPTVSMFHKTGVMVARVLTTPTNDTCCVRMMNVSTKPARLWRGMSLGTLREVEEQRQYSALSPQQHPEQQSASASATEQVSVVEAIQQQIDDDLANVDKLKKSPYTTLPPHIEELYHRSTAELDDEQQRDLYQLLSVYQDTFAKDANDIGTTKWVKHDVDTGDEPPVRQRPRRLRFEQRPILQQLSPTYNNRNVSAPARQNGPLMSSLSKRKVTTPRKAHNGVCA